MADSDVDLEIGAASVSLRRQVVDKLRQAIVRGRFSPGEHLSDRALCDLFKVSRTVVREAIRQLETEGLVESLPHRGSFVRVLSPGEAMQIYDVRGALESLAVRKFVECATDEDIERLSQALDRIKDGHFRGAEEELVDNKQAFYDIILKTYRNDFLMTMLGQILNWSFQLRAASMSSRERIPKSIGELEKVMAAIRRRDSGGASQAILEHVENAAAAALLTLNEDKAPAVAARR